MTIRSMPPASSHLAESPVPAPPPMIGCPRRIMARNFLSISLRAMRGMACLRRYRSGPSRAIAGGGGAGDLVKGCDYRLGEFWIVHIVRHADQLAIGGAAKERGDRAEERLVGLGIPERLAWRVEQRDAALGDDEAHRALHAVQLLGDEAANGGALGRRRAHQRDVVVVLVELALAEARRHGVHGPEIDHVEG